MARRAKPKALDAPLETDAAGRPRYRGPLSMGDKGLAVAWVNRRLTERGLMPAGSNDRFTISTYKAVVALQADAGLRQTGRVDSAAWVLL